MPSKEVYHQRKADGLCPRCGDRPPVEGKAKCQNCLDYEAATQKATRDARKADGLCPSCGDRPPVEGKAKCQNCIDYAAAASKATYDDRKADGLCPSCGDRPPVEGKAKCQNCIDYDTAAKKATYDSRKAAGMCTECGEPSELVTCRECRRNGLRKHMQFLRFRDGQDCHICRSRLPVANSSDVHVHHVIPRSIGGPDDLDNLSLTHAACNRAVGARWVPHIPPGPYTLGGESGNPSTFVSYTTGTLDGSANM